METSTLISFNFLQILNKIKCVIINMNAYSTVNPRAISESLHFPLRSMFVHGSPNLGVTGHDEERHTI